MIGIPMSRFALPALLAAGAIALAGCYDYVDRRESISFGAGDAQQANLITHVVHPLPRHAANRRLLFSGQRMGAAVGRYRAGQVTRPAGGTTSVGASN